VCGETNCQRIAVAAHWPDLLEGTAMDPNFWHDAWAENRTGFHEAEANALLTRHFASLALPAKARIFVPLCGKTRDIAWALAQGHRVVGVELSELAITQLFEELGATPNIFQSGRMKHYAAPSLDIFVGDIFNLTADQIGPVDAIYDRAALVALPDGLRDRYAKHLTDITDTAQQLLICFEYEPGAVQGPPFSIDGAEVARLYGESYTITELARRDAPNGLRGSPATEVIRHLS